MTKKTAGAFFSFRDVEDLGVHWGRAIVEGDGNFLVRRADAVDVIGERNGVVRFVSERSLSASYSKERCRSWVYR